MSKEVEIFAYDKSYKTAWDVLVSKSKNGTFFHQRDFVEYHVHRFEDCSCMFIYDGKLVGVLPMNIDRENKIVYSHQGLSFGGLVLDFIVNTVTVLKIFNLLFKWLKETLGMERFIYKVIPHIYHKVQAQEDLYALYFNDAQLIRRAPSTVINFSYPLIYKELRKRQIKKAKNNPKLFIQESFDFENYWEILEYNLMETHQVVPVHSLAEILYLKTKFYNNIHLYIVTEIDNIENVLAGVVLFKNDTVVRVQYIATIKKGRVMGALDLLFDILIKQYKSLSSQSNFYFDFGISTEVTKGEHKNLNEGLIWQKEGFGGHTVVYDTYEMSL